MFTSRLVHGFSPMPVATIDALAQQFQTLRLAPALVVQAISEFQNKQSSYDAALKTYSMVQRMSLFQYLSP